MSTYNKTATRHNSQPTTVNPPSNEQNEKKKKKDITNLFNRQNFIKKSNGF